MARLALEQSKMKQKGLSNGRKVEKDVHKLSIKPRNKRPGSIDCNTLLYFTDPCRGKQS